MRIIPGPISVGAITETNAPAADILAKYEQVTTTRLGEGENAFSRIVATEDEYSRSARYVVWRGSLVPNPALIEEASLHRAEGSATSGWEVLVPFDPVWGGTNSPTHRVRDIRIPLMAPEGAASGAYLPMDDSRLFVAIRGLLEVTAGMGSTTAGGTPIESLPDDGETFSFDSGRDAATAYALVRGPPEAVDAGAVPSALFGSRWPAIHGVIGSTVHDGYPVTGGLLSTVYLDHFERIAVSLDELAGTLTATSHVTGVTDIAADRIIGVDTRVMDDDGRKVAFFADRFALRDHVGEEQLEDPKPRVGVGDVVDTLHSVLGSAKVSAPTDITTFAIVSGDYNPTHTSHRGARLVGLDEPIVHGMRLYAAAEYATQKIVGTRILG